MSLRGLYALTPDSHDDEHLLRQVEAAIHGGVRLLQYRNKSATAQTRQRQAQQLARLCRHHRVQYIINDDIALAQLCQADGVHLGAHDTAIHTARQQLGTRAIIGSTCHNSPAAAVSAAAAGATYVAMGAVFSSATKPAALHCPLHTLTAAKAQLTALHVPLVAIGGITADNAATVIDAGADAIAVINGLFNCADITAAAQRLCRQFATNHASPTGCA